MKTDADVIVVGGGLVGASMACALGRAGLRSIVIEPAPADARHQPSFDERTIALTYSARQVFEGLDLWGTLVATDEVSPILGIEVSDRAGSGVCHLSQRELGVDALGYVIPTRVLGRVLHERMRQDPRIDLRCPALTEHVNAGASRVSVRLSADGNRSEVTARVVVLADGGRSPLGQRAGLVRRQRRYTESALVTVVGTDRPHEGLAYERFVGAGPLALLPLRETDYAVAWTLPAEQVQRYAKLDEKEFCAALAAQFDGRLGAISAVGPRTVYPLDLTRVTQPRDARIVAVGNAAHVVHPVAGQGFNLGLRDVVGLCDVLSKAHASGDDIGAPQVLASYHAERGEETRRVGGFTDALIGVFGSELAPLRRGRNAALKLIDRLPAVKRELLWRTTGLGSRHARLVRRTARTSDAAERYDVIVAGAGLIGGAMACLLAEANCRVALIDRRLPGAGSLQPGVYDLRINAYNRAAEQMLRRLQVWDRVPEERRFAFRHIWVGNERGPGSVAFSAADAGETHLGHFIENRLVAAALLERAGELPNIDVLDGRELDSVEYATRDVFVNCGSDEQFAARLLVGADGANSRVRAAAGIGLRMRPYAQRCIVGTVEFEGDLGATAWQRFLYTGPLGLLPLAPGACSLAWSCADERAAELLELDDEAFIAALEAAVVGRLGRIRRVGPRAAFPLTARDAVAYNGPRTALLGDAAHVVHPLAGLGANIGFKDAVTLAGLVLQATQRDRDIGSERLLRRYARRRRAESRLLMTTMSAFNTVFSNRDALLGTLRDRGLDLADRFWPAKNFLMRRAMWMDFDAPFALRGAASAHPAEAREET